MSSFIVEGGTRLSGTIRVSGNKNEALPIIAASLLSSGPVSLTNVPEIGDVRNMLEIASVLGAGISPISSGKVTIEAPRIGSSELPPTIKRYQGFYPFCVISSCKNRKGSYHPAWWRHDR